LVTYTDWSLTTRIGSGRLFLGTSGGMTGALLLERM
jgi:hypothetical protein